MYTREETALASTTPPTICIKVINTHVTSTLVQIALNISLIAFRLDNYLG